MFASLAIDVLSEICGHGPPLSVLYLTRTSKSIRNLLVSESGKRAWVRARRQIGVPNPNTGVSEPQYASFLFEDGCQAPGCATTECHWDYVFSLRYCNACMLIRKSTAKEVLDLWRSQQLPALGLACLPWDQSFVSSDAPLTIWTSIYRKSETRFLELAGRYDKDFELLYDEIDAERMRSSRRGSVIFKWQCKFDCRPEIKLARFYEGREKEMIEKLGKMRKEFTEGVIDDFRHSNAGKTQWQAYIKGHPRNPVKWRVDEDLPDKKLSQREWQVMSGPLEIAIVRYRDSKNATPRSRTERRPWALALEDVTGVPAKAQAGPRGAS